MTERKKDPFSDTAIDRKIDAALRRRPTTAQKMLSASDFPDRYPKTAILLGALSIAGGLWKLQGAPMYVAVGIGVVIFPGLKRGVIGLVAGLAPYVPFLKKPNGEAKP